MSQCAREMMVEFFLIRVMAKAAEVERERRARMVPAEEEYQASVKLAQMTKYHAASCGAPASHARDDGRSCAFGRRAGQRV